MQARRHQVIHDVVAIRNRTEYAGDFLRLVVFGHFLEAEIGGLVQVHQDLPFVFRFSSRRILRLARASPRCRPAHDTPRPAPAFRDTAATGGAGFFQDCKDNSQSKAPRIGPPPIQTLPHKFPPPPPSPFVRPSSPPAPPPSPRPPPR